MLHIALSKHLDFAAMDAESVAGASPRHVVRDLARMTGARVHMPGDPRTATVADALRAKLFGAASHWALARSVVRHAMAGDAIFATGEDVGIPLAAYVGARQAADRPRLAIFAHNIARPRARAAISLFRCARANATWLMNSSEQRRFLESSMHVPASRIHMIPEQTDTEFFVPAQTNVETSRSPLIVSVGLERRDYHTLAAAAGDLPVHVELSAFSKDARGTRDAMPEALPGNFSVRRYSWSELRTLYQQAVVVVVPLFESQFCAGFTALLEALACGAPVVITRTTGLGEHLARAAPFTGNAISGDVAKSIALSVPPGDAPALRAAIQWILDHPQAAREMAARGSEWVRSEHSPECWFESITKALRGGESLSGSEFRLQAAARMDGALVHTVRSETA